MKRVLLFLIFACIAKFLFAQAGNFDTTFNHKGIFVGAGYDMAVQSNGKVIGFASLGNGKAGVERINFNGTVDSSFGKNGFTDSIKPSAGSLAIQNDGKIVVAGAFNNGFSLERFNKNGDVDKTFGKNGVTTILSDKIQIAILNDLAIQNDGKLLIAGAVYYKYDQPHSIGYHFTVGRFNTDGTADSGFGGTALIIVDSFGINSASSCYAYKMAIQNDKKIIVTGEGFKTTKGIIDLARFNVNGTFDSSFGINGRVEVTNPADVGRAEGGDGVALQSDGKIVVTGPSGYPSDEDPVQDYGYVFAVRRFNINGSLDSTFGINSRSTNSFGKKAVVAKDLVIQTDDKILVCGFSETDKGNKIVLARYNVNGNLDSSFAKNGSKITDLPAGVYTQEYARTIKLFNERIYLALNGTIEAYKNDEAVLAVNLTTFNAIKKTNSDILLNWQTASEQNINQFTVERSSDGIHFLSIGTIKSTGINSLVKNYYFDDLKPLQNENYYRLKIQDADAAYNYSHIVLIDNNLAKQVIRLLPNPAHKYFTIINATPFKQIQLITNKGLVVKQWDNNPSQTFLLPDLAKGFYYVRIIDNKTSQVQKLVIQ